MNFYKDIPMHSTQGQWLNQSAAWSPHTRNIIYKKIKIQKWMKGTVVVLTNYSYTQNKIKIKPDQKTPKPRPTSSFTYTQGVVISLLEG